MTFIILAAVIAVLLFIIGISVDALAWLIVIAALVLLIDFVLAPYYWRRPRR